MTEIIETGITWDHDEGTIDVSTRSRKVAHRLKSLGFEPENPDSDDYLVFRVKESKLKIRFSLPRALTPAQREVLVQMRVEKRRGQSAKQTKQAPPADKANEGTEREAGTPQGERPTPGGAGPTEDRL